MRDWRKSVDELRAGLHADPIVQDYFDANRDAVERALGGLGPDPGGRRDGAGAHVAVNLACAHVPAVCHATDDRPYKNCYDLGRHVVGDATPARRTLVDQSLPLNEGDNYRDVYFGAVELNGAGVRFYGDVCLVLRDDVVHPRTVVLDRNSYDLERLPLRKAIYAHVAERDQFDERCDIARAFSGCWSADLPAMALLKIAAASGARARRLTTGQISDGIVADEDYMEVLFVRDGAACRSFGAPDLLEARLAAADVAVEERIGARTRNGPAPPVEQLIWRDRRRAAEAALRAADVPVRVITASGRVRA